jgi:heme/copper-type cytochrome/quinol oxidase subunit 2
MSMRYYSCTSSDLEMKFTPQQIELLIKTRDEIRDLSDRQHKLYDNLAKELNVTVYAEDWLFDYIYNEYGSIEDIENRMN